MPRPQLQQYAVQYQQVSMVTEYEMKHVKRPLDFLPNQTTTTSSLVAMNIEQKSNERKCTAMSSKVKDR